jgi:photosynthetic reaction center cytochrome c subunit/tetratricopeptide repeat protein
MKRLFTGLAAFGLIVCTASWVAAQAQPPAGGGGGGAQQPPPPLTNLQIYPKDTARPELIATMQGFVRQLGVQTQGGCAYCHAGTAPQLDYASDTNPKKNIARKMILMSREITGKLPDVTGKPAAQITALRCATCHRGMAVPKVTEVALTDAAAKGGAAATVQQYKDTRKQALDYNQNALVAYATTLINGDKADDALTVLRANAELDPNHAPTYAAMAQAYAKKNDKDGQIKMLEKAVQIDPNNQNLKRQLDQLKTGK